MRRPPFLPQPPPLPIVVVALDGGDDDDGDDDDDDDDENDDDHHTAGNITNLHCILFSLCCWGNWKPPCTNIFLQKAVDPLIAMITMSTALELLVAEFQIVV